jgi:hypothetical protein
MSKETFVVCPQVYAYFEPTYLPPPIYAYPAPIELATVRPKIYGPYGPHTYGPY